MIGAIERAFQKGRDVFHDGLAVVMTTSSDEEMTYHEESDQGTETWKDTYEALSGSWIFNQQRFWLFLWSLSNESGHRSVKVDQSEEYDGKNVRSTAQFLKVYSEVMSQSSRLPVWETVSNQELTNVALKVDLYRGYLLNNIKSEIDLSKNSGRGIVPTIREMERGIYKLAYEIRNNGFTLQDLTTMSHSIVSDIAIQGVISPDETLLCDLNQLEYPFFDGAFGIWPLKLDIENMYASALGMHSPALSPFTALELQSAEANVFLPPRSTPKENYRIMLNGRRQSGTWYHFLTAVLVPHLIEIILKAPDGSPLTSHYSNIRQYFQEPLNLSKMDSNGGDHLASQANHEDEFGSSVPGDLCLVEWHQLYILAHMILRWCSDSFKYDICVITASILRIIASDANADEQTNRGDDDMCHLTINKEGHLILSWETLASVGHDEFKVYFRLHDPEFLTESLSAGIALALGSYHNFHSFKPASSKSGINKMQDECICPSIPSDLSVHQYTANLIVGSPKYPRAQTDEKLRAANVWLRALLNNKGKSLKPSVKGVICVRRV